MAVPTIATLAPVTGPALGRNFISITGTGFRVPPTPPAGPIASSDVQQTVRVSFDAEVVGTVEVSSSTLLRVLVPAFRGTVADSQAANIPAVDLTVENLDDNGVLIPGETVTSTGAYTYARTSLRPPGTDVWPFQQITEELLLTYTRAVVPNVHLATHTDFSEAPFQELFAATLPSLHLVGPTAEFDPEFTHEEYRFVSIGGGASEIFDPPNVFRLTYDIIGIVDGERELHATMTAVREVHERAAYLYVDDPVSSSRFRYPLLQTADPVSSGGPSNSNIRTFTSTIMVQGVAVFFDEPRGRTQTVDQILLEASDLVGNSPEMVPIGIGGFADGFDRGFF